MRSVTSRLAKMVSLKGLQRPVTRMPGMLRSKWLGIDRAAALVPATCEDIWDHLPQAMKTVRPIDADSSREATDLRIAVTWSEARHQRTRGSRRDMGTLRRNAGVHARRHPPLHGSCTSAHTRDAGARPARGLDLLLRRGDGVA